MFSFLSFFRVTAVSDLRKELLREAEMNHLQHAGAAEHHDALAKMYASRMIRLREEIAQDLAYEQGLSVAKEARLEEKAIALATATKPREQPESTLAARASQAFCPAA